MTSNWSHWLHLSPILSPEQWGLGLVVILPGELRTDCQPEDELRPLGHRGEHLLLGAARVARGGEVGAQHQGIQNLESVQARIVPAPLAFLHIGLEIDVSHCQGDSLEESGVRLDFVVAFNRLLSIFEDQSISRRPERSILIVLDGEELIALCSPRFTKQNNAFIFSVTPHLIRSPSRLAS